MGLQAMLLNHNILLLNAAVYLNTILKLNAWSCNFRRPAVTERFYIFLTETAFLLSINMTFST